MPDWAWAAVGVGVAVVLGATAVAFRRSRAPVRRAAVLARTGPARPAGDAAAAAGAADRAAAGRAARHVRATAGNGREHAARRGEAPARGDGPRRADLPGRVPHRPAGGGAAGRRRWWAARSRRRGSAAASRTSSGRRCCRPRDRPRQAGRRAGRRRVGVAWPGCTVLSLSMLFGGVDGDHAARRVRHRRGVGGEPRGVHRLAGRHPGRTRPHRDSSGCTWRGRRVDVLRRVLRLRAGARGPVAVRRPRLPARRRRPPGHRRVGYWANLGGFMGCTCSAGPRSPVRRGPWRCSAGRRCWCSRGRRSRSAARAGRRSSRVGVQRAAAPATRLFPVPGWADGDPLRWRERHLAPAGCCGRAGSSSGAGLLALLASSGTFGCAGDLAGRAGHGRRVQPGGVADGRPSGPGWSSRRGRCSLGLIGGHPRRPGRSPRERQRRSLESLLMLPMERAAMLGAKLSAAVFQVRYGLAALAAAAVVGLFTWGCTRSGSYWWRRRRPGSWRCRPCSGCGCRSAAGRPPGRRSTTPCGLRCWSSARWPPCRWPSY